MSKTFGLFFLEIYIFSLVIVHFLKLNKINQNVDFDFSSCDSHKWNLYPFHCCCCVLFPVLHWSKLYLSEWQPQTKCRPQVTGHRSQSQVLTVLITNWDKQFPLNLKLYLRLWFGLKDTVSIVFFHSTVTCTLTCMSLGSK